MTKPGLKIPLRVLAVLFFAAAFAQWLSYNWPTASQSAMSSATGWLLTVIIAAPGALLWAVSNNR
ncbi:MULTISPECIES: hypothetical protein [Agrobacterium]|uniref:hypothetical protein n=1 Tax=Agrobacterium TaxID=357 RepID=UPI000DD412BE|nr:MULTISPECIES: hypothetical protein [Agrobacterium]MBO9108023.1 hypothetical protein [Agrobacterium sp. S2/73]NTA15251.1 hypothetical protein [Agrobacterium tumefaciens]NTA80182.1 hypothetical protein [Agrobacterium tumefaciens]QXZ71384.1 hypothetical protein J5276_09710 [Agrobacterium sp. S7/73]WCK71489.1 hypothetical protein G6L96_003205 [Agrobacterium tumefaciens]